MQATFLWPSSFALPAPFAPWSVGVHKGRTCRHACRCIDILELYCCPEREMRTGRQGRRVSIAVIDMSFAQPFVWKNQNSRRTKEGGARGKPWIREPYLTTSDTSPDSGQTHCLFSNNFSIE